MPPDLDHEPAPHRRSRPRFTVRHASDLLAVIPYLVGFHPTESIVAVLMRSGQVALTMRVDLPTTSSVADAGGRARPTARRCRGRNQLIRIILVGYSADQLAGQSGAQRDHGRGVPQLERPGVELGDIYCVDGERWWSLTCDGPSRSREGTAYDLGSPPVRRRGRVRRNECRAEPCRAAGG